MASLPPVDDHRSLVKRINSSNYFLNKQLQHICSLNGLRTQGVKAELQKRLIEGTSRRFFRGVRGVRGWIFRHRWSAPLPVGPLRGQAQLFCLTTPPSSSAVLINVLNHPVGLQLPTQSALPLPYHTWPTQTDGFLFFQTEI